MALILPGADVEITFLAIRKAPNHHNIRLQLMPSISWKRVGCLSSTAVVVLLLTIFWRFAYSTIQRVHAYTTQAYMTGISSLLADYKPQIRDSGSFRVFLRQHDREGYFRDGWGHHFVIETWTERGSRSYHYRIISLGRAGKRTSCCQATVGHNWDLNTVLQDDKWAQRWDF
jgi:hypothetical protein